MIVLEYKDYLFIYLYGGVYVIGGGKVGFWEVIILVV